jgi:hypothetical protein
MQKVASHAIQLILPREEAFEVEPKYIYFPWLAQLRGTAHYPVVFELETIKHSHFAVDTLKR